MWHIFREMLQGVYERIRHSEFRPGSDHVTQVMKVQQTIVSKCPNLAVSYRRLVCYCRLYEVNDPNKKDRPGKIIQICWQQNCVIYFMCFQVNTKEKYSYSMIFL